MVELFLSAFITLFVVIDPPGCAPIYAGLSASASPVQKRSMAIRAVVVASLILVVFAAFRIAGGIMLFLIALEMVFEKRTQRRESRAQEVEADPEHDDVSVFPMAIPMIAGPGSIASVMLLMARSDGLDESLVVLAALASVLLLTLLSLLAAGWLMRLLGHRLEAMLTRLLGVVLAALAAQFVIDGIAVSFEV